LGFSSPDATATFKCSVDGAAYAVCTSPFTTPALVDGSHTVSIKAVDTAGNEDASPASRTFTVSTGVIHVNFEPAGGGTVAGYVNDGGDVYGARGNGYSYGWSQDETANTRTRTGTGSSDLRYNTLVTLSYTTSASWKIAVPNGQYSVHLV